MENGTIYRMRKVNKRDANKIPTTTVTNELADGLNGLMIFRSGSVNSPTFGGSASGPQFVTLQVNGGEQGSSGTDAATYTYDCYSIPAGTKVQTAVPVADRTFLGPVYLAKSGVLVIGWNGGIGTGSGTGSTPFLILANETPISCG